MLESRRGGIRRLQKLGSSSLVVTLPKEWVKRLGLKPGDPVYVAVEGDTVRVIPIEGERGESRLRINLQKVTPGEAVKILWCSYVMGPEEVVLEGAGEEVYEALKDAAGGFIGVEVVRDDRGVGIAILVDPSRVDVRASIRGVASDIQDVVDLLLNALRGFEIKGEVVKARLRLQRSLTLAERYLMGVLSIQGPSVDAKTVASTLLATNFLGLAASTLLDAVSIVLTLRPERTDEMESVLKQLSQVSTEAALNIANPSIKRGVEVLAKIDSLKKRVDAIMTSTSSGKPEAVLASKLSEAPRHLHLASVLVYCMLKTQETVKT